MTTVAKGLKVFLVMDAADAVATAVERGDVVHFHPVMAATPDHAPDAVGLFSRAEATVPAGVAIALESGELGGGPLVVHQKDPGTLAAAPPGLTPGEGLAAGGEGAAAFAEDKHAAGGPPGREFLGATRHASMLTEA